MTAVQETASVRSTVADAIVTVEIAHAAKRNAMTRSMWRQLKATFEALDTRAIRCVLVRGAGGHFCAGGDISEYPAFRFDETQLAHFHEVEVWGALSALLACDVPVVAAIDGNCMGAGLEIACCCDLRLAGESANFGAPIARLGFPMAPREAGLMAQVLGSSVARAMLLAAEVFPAQRLASTGFLTRIVPDAQLHAQALDWVRRIATLAPQAARSNKQVFRDATFTPGAYTYAYAKHPEHREGITAFLEKRRPDF